MFEQERRTFTKPSRPGLDAICADYLETLHRALAGARAIPRETRLRHQRLSIRFARKIRIGGRGLVAIERRDDSAEKLLDQATQNTGV